MRLAYVCADRGISVKGGKGAAVHLRSLAGAIARRGHEVLLAATRSDGPEPIPPGVHLVSLPAPADVAVLSRSLSDWGAEAVLERHSLGGGAALDVAAELGLTYVLEVNAPLVEEAARFRGLQEVAHWRRWERDLLRRAGKVVVVSRALRDFVIGEGAEAGAVTVIPNGVEPDLFDGRGRDHVRRRLGLDGAMTIGFAGSLKPWHGVRTLLRAAHQLPAAYRVLIVGDGPERRSLEDQAAEEGLRGRVLFTGQVSHAEVPDYVGAMDITCAPFDHLPGFWFSPLKVVEYMAAGRPVVASRQGDLDELLGGAGLTVRPAEPDELAAALLELGDSPGRRRRMGEIGRARAREMSWDAVAARVEGLFDTTGLGS